MPSSSRLSKKRKSREYTQLREPLSDIYSRLHAIGVIQPRKEKVIDLTHPQFDPSKRCAFHSDAQGHDIEECVALKHKNSIAKASLTVRGQSSALPTKRSIH
ncbi:hypothetical protein HAX54_020385 [Datura stramonium]|uniref:Uncharacterized protein n=1 Tax=Datura stramonium TaxID=4076 RepID=A0ABS8UR45_DATST|nr:hypothetical protein [Datura stramonium]